MPYTDPTTVRVALSPGGDDTDRGSAASLPDDDLLAKIADATDEVDAKLAGRYTTPFTNPAPAMISTITTAIAGYLATLTYRRGDPLPQGDPVLLAYQRAEQLLTQLQTGQAVLAGPTPPTPGPGAGPVVTNVLTDNLFSLADFADWPGYGPDFVGR